MEKAVPGAGVRLIGRQSLFFGFAFGADGSLKGEARSGVWPETCSTGRVLRARFDFGLRSAEALQRENELADFDLVSPSFTFTSLTTPLTDEGTSMTALSVSSSMTGWPSETLLRGRS